MHCVMPLTWTVGGFYKIGHKVVVSHWHSLIEKAFNVMKFFQYWIFGAIKSYLMDWQVGKEILVICRKYRSIAS